MPRLERPKGTENQNPATKFLNWKSDQKAFVFYDKEKKENVLVELPLKCVFLEHYTTIKGWHDATQNGIYSNEVYALSQENLTVKTFGGLEIAKGLYKDIKLTVNNAGGHYTRSVYVMLNGGEIANIQLKGSAVGGVKQAFSKSKKDVDGYSEFYNKNGKLLDNQYMEILSFEEAKKGATNYSIPVFSIGKHLADEDNLQADECAKFLQNYINKYTGKTEDIAVIEPEVVCENEDLEF